MGMLLGLIALTGMYVGMNRVVKVYADWSELYADFRDTCETSADLLRDRALVEADNIRLRDALRLEPRVYPAPDIPRPGERTPAAPVWSCADLETNTLPTHPPEVIAMLGERGSYRAR